MARFIQFIVKVTKHCNLRCRYCYEFEHLSDRRFIAIADMTMMFTNMRRIAEARGFDYIHIIWHGGEPLLRGIDYYRALIDIQHQVFGDEIAFENAVQTNLTIIDDAILAFLKDRVFFNTVSVSFDAFGDQRVDIRGRQTNEKVIENAVRLMEAEIPFGVISVLTRPNIETLPQTMKFFDQIGQPFRILPYYMSADRQQLADNAMSFDALAEAHRAMFDLWFTSENATPMMPVADYLDIAIDALSGETPGTLAKAEETAIIVDTDGMMYGLSDPYIAGFDYGNILTPNVSASLETPGRARAISEADDRVRRICGSCRYFGICNSAHVIEAPPDIRDDLDAGNCIVRSSVDHMLVRLRASRDLAPLLASFDGSRAREARLPTI